MEDLYLTKRDLDNSIDKSNAIDKLVKNKRCRILIDLDSDTVSKMVDDPSCEILFSYLRDNDKTLYSGKEMVDAIKKTVEKNRTICLMAFQGVCFCLMKRTQNLQKWSRDILVLNVY